MKKNKVKDEIFIINQPSHAVLSLVVVDSEFPIPELSHEVMERLKDSSDVFLVFSDKYFSKSKKINKNKFANLYGVCGWIDSMDNLYYTILKAVQYSIEIFANKHVAYSLINMSDVKNLGNSYFDNILSVTGSTVTKPIFKLRRLNSREFFDIYSEYSEDENKKKKGCKIINRIFKKEEDNTCSITNMFSSYTSTSTSMFFKKNTMNLFINFRDDEKSKSYIDSFDTSDFRNFFASMVKYLGISIIDSSIERLNVGNLSNNESI